MFGVADIGKVIKEMEKIHELTGETAKLVKGVHKLNGLLERQNQLLELLLEKEATPKKKRSKNATTVP